MFRVNFLLTVFGCTFAFLCVSGCGSKNAKVVEVPLSSQNLRKISLAYLQATNRLDRPPQNLTELMPFLKEQGEPSELLRSPEDGQNYIIFWGIDFRSLAAQSIPFPVLAHEKQGKDGKRFVLQGRNILQLTDEELKRAPFPPGHRSP